ncbi:MAG: biotin/lipoyl-binding protein [Gammaproteobacteria bacterium]|nr:biotin/lipoyl-binding protein [Gammaproteobacteria bacterium]
MRRFKISVDGVAYDVMVEELEPDGKILPTLSETAKETTTTADAAIGTPPPPKKIKAATNSPQAAAAGDVTSPLAGTILEVKVSAGQKVDNGDLLLVLEAMKMESMIVAPVEGRVQSISVSAGDSVVEGQVLLSITTA